MPACCLHAVCISTCAMRPALLVQPSSRLGSVGRRALLARLACALVVGARPAARVAARRKELRKRKPKVRRRHRDRDLWASAVRECGAKRILSIGILIALLSLIGVWWGPLKSGARGGPPLSPPSRAGAGSSTPMHTFYICWWISGKNPFVTYWMRRQRCLRCRFLLGAPSYRFLI